MVFRHLAIIADEKESQRLAGFFDSIGEPYYAEPQDLMKDSDIVPYLTWCEDDGQDNSGWRRSTTCAVSEDVITVDELIHEYKEYELRQIEMMELADEMLY